MSAAWATVLVVGAGTIALKAVGPVGVSGRRLPGRVTELLDWRRSSSPKRSRAVDRSCSIRGWPDSRRVWSPWCCERRSGSL